MSGSTSVADGQDVFDALTAFGRLTRLLRRSGLADRAAREAGVHLDRTCLTILGTVRKSDEPPNIKQIAESLQVEGPHVTRHVKELDQLGLITRTADPHDRRICRIAASAEGIEQIDRYHAVVKRWMHEALGDWSAEDRASICRLIDRWADDLEARLDRLSR